MKSVSKALIAVVMSGLLVAAFLVGAASAASTPPVAVASASCTAATNIEAIVDDSGSMEITDPNKLRVQAVDLLTETLPTATTLGAVEFGSGIEGVPGYSEGIPAAYTIFSPEPIGPNKAAMQEALSHNINADDGLTDYNAAFAKSDSDNPGAQARIFLTDGGHDAGTYNEAHLAHNVPTYVIGFGGLFGEDKARLKKIASDTGGQVFELDEAGEIQAVVNSIGAALTCKTPPRSFTDEISQGQSKTHTIAIGAKTHSLQVTLTWSNPGDKFKLGGLSVKSRGQVVATLSRSTGKRKPAPKPKKLSVSTVAGSSTYTVLRVGHLRPGTLSFSVKGAKVSGGSVKVTTQVEGAGAAK
jgi:hypothetical protein